MKIFLLIFISLFFIETSCADVDAPLTVILYND